MAVMNEFGVEIKSERSKMVPEDSINHPKHYTSHPSGVEAIDLCKHENFCIGNCMKYLIRCEHKGNKLEDLKKAAWYLNCEIERLEKQIERSEKQ